MTDRFSGIALASVLALTLVACDSGVVPDAAAPEFAATDGFAFGKDHKTLLCHNGIETDDGGEGITLIAVATQAVDSHLAHGDTVCEEPLSCEGKTDSDLDGIDDGCDSCPDDFGEGEDGCPEAESVCTDGDGRGWTLEAFCTGTPSSAHPTSVDCQQACEPENVCGFGASRTYLPFFEGTSVCVPD